MTPVADTPECRLADANRIEPPFVHLAMEAHSFIDNDQELADVPAEIIGSLKPFGIILISTTAKKIACQRKMDERKRPARTVSAATRWCSNRPNRRR